MSNLKQYLSDYLKQKNMLQKDFAELIGVQPNTLSQWVNGKRQPDEESWIKLSRALKVSIDDLLGVHTYPRKGVKIPVFGSVAAGIPIEAITDIEDYEEITEDLAASGEFVALKIKGDSMEPKMSDGDVVIVRIQPDIESGETAIVMINGNDATCKKVKKSMEGIMLISTNPAYEPMFYSNKQIEELPIRIFGKVVELRAKF